MARLRLRRARGIIDMFRAYQVVLDGQPGKKIRRGQTVDLEIDPGSHSLELRVDWYRSNLVIFEAGDGPVCFDCGNNLDGKKLLVAPFHLIFPKGDYLWLRRAEVT